MTATPIETRYAGCRFRSRLEARWAVFLDTMGIPWQYEPQGFVIDTQPYLPDFLLPECGTWIEVKGDEARLDRAFLSRAAVELPVCHNKVGELGPKLLILGSIPEPVQSGDWGWIGLTADGGQGRYGLGTYPKNRRPWWLDNGQHQPGSSWLTPVYDRYEWDAYEAYTAARSARFEHRSQQQPNKQSE